MAEEYSQEQLWKLYETLPEDLKDAIFSVDTANSIYETCKRSNLEEKVSQVAKHTGYVLLGLLSPDEFAETLKKEMDLNADIAKKVSQEITRFVFYPLRTTLEELYKTKIEQTKKPEPTETSKEILGKDVYREPVE